MARKVLVALVVRKVPVAPVVRKVLVVLVVRKVLVVLVARKVLVVLVVPVVHLGMVSWRTLLSNVEDSSHIEFFAGRAADLIALFFDLNDRTLTIGKAVGA
jgi:hypothetical protein